ncbi:uncharacterized protein LOC127264368 [Andrographis paniculata]|uniref:uncharacterized protein LOC127264368 n=1 Tax=Andrographis paniculata TaxID=175694 RepID=UPI0021E74684|nr:uncharacterized protein LOC127264368 [Andrographis paniculata]
MDDSYDGEFDGGDSEHDEDSYDTAMEDQMDGDDDLEGEFTAPTTDDAEYWDGITSGEEDDDNDGDGSGFEGLEEEIHRLHGEDDELPEMIVISRDLKVFIERMMRTRRSRRVGSRQHLNRPRAGTHTCAHQIRNTQADYKYLGRRIKSIVSDNLDITLPALKKMILREVRVDASMHKVYRAKKYAMQMIRGDRKEQYRRLYDYCATFCKYNEGTNLILDVNGDSDPHVLRIMYYCLSGLRDGFLDKCRMIIGLDGCFLKGIYKGQLLTAVGRDPNENIYPLAFAFFEIEKFETWDYF